MFDDPMEAHRWAVEARERLRLHERYPDTVLPPWADAKAARAKRRRPDGKLFESNIASAIGGTFRFEGVEHAMIPAEEGQDRDGHPEVTIEGRRFLLYPIQRTPARAKAISAAETRQQKAKEAKQAELAPKGDLPPAKQWKEDLMRWGEKEGREVARNKVEDPTLEIACKFKAYRTYRRKKSEGTLKFDRSKILVIWNRFGKDTPLSRITEMDIEDWRDDRLKEVSPNAVRKELTMLGTIYSWATKYLGYRSPDPTIMVNKPSMEAADLPRFTVAQVNAFIDSVRATKYPKAEYHANVMTLFTMLYGRRAELVGLRIEHVDMDRKVVRIPKEIAKSRKGDRLYRIDPDMKQVLNYFIGDRTEGHVIDMEADSVTGFFGKWQKRLTDEKIDATGFNARAVRKTFSVAMEKLADDPNAALEQIDHSKKVHDEHYDNDQLERIGPLSQTNQRLRRIRPSKDDNRT